MTKKMNKKNTLISNHSILGYFHKTYGSVTELKTINEEVLRKKRPLHIEFYYIDITFSEYVCYSPLKQLI